jgi:flagellar motor protein MotB
MARKKKHEEHVNHERWLVSYADFITLLFATFTALFAISNADKEKFQQMAHSLKNAFATDMPTDVRTLHLKGKGLQEHNKKGFMQLFKISRATAA